MNLTKLIGSFNFKKFSKAGRTDFGVLKVAFMVAALDGEVTDAEYRAFDALAKKCRGYTPKAAEKALDEAMRSAGYLMLLSKRAKDDDLVKAFVAEAQAALPSGFPPTCVITSRTRMPASLAGLQTPVFVSTSQKPTTSTPSV